MGMQETPGSIRAYFILVGVLSGICNFLNFSAGMGGGALALVVLSVFGMVLSVGYLVVGLLMPKLIPNGAPVPKALVAINSAFLVALIALLMAYLPPEAAGSASVRPGIGLLVNWYLWANLSRLSKEQDEKGQENRDA